MKQRGLEMLKAAITNKTSFLVKSPFISSFISRMLNLEYCQNNLLKVFVYFLGAIGFTTAMFGFLIDCFTVPKLRGVKKDKK